MLAWVVILGAVGLLAAAVLVPRVAGATPYAVLTGSMQPGLPPGTLIVVRPVNDADLALGDIVTYQLESGEAPVVTHRVVAMGYDGRGELRLQTQGDANDVPDAAWYGRSRSAATLVLGAAGRLPAHLALGPGARATGADRRRRPDRLRRLDVPGCCAHPPASEPAPGERP